MRMHVFVCASTCMQTPMELELQVVANPLMWVLEAIIQSLLQKQQVFLTDGPSPQPQISVVKSLFKMKTLLSAMLFLQQRKPIPYFLSVIHVFSPHFLLSLTLPIFRTLLLKIYLFFYMYVCLAACMSAHHVHASCGFWKSNSNPLKEHQVLLSLRHLSPVPF